MIILLNQLIKKENTDNKWKEKIYLLILEKIKLYNLKLILHQICGLKEETRLLYIFKEKLEVIANKRENFDKIKKRNFKLKNFFFCNIYNFKSKNTFIYIFYLFL
jgi:hypothetical protein